MLPGNQIRSPSQQLGRTPRYHPVVLVVGGVKPRRESCVCARCDSLVLELPGELGLRLLQLLPGRDVLPDDVPHLCLHQLQFGKELRRKPSRELRLMIRAPP